MTFEGFLLREKKPMDVETRRESNEEGREGGDRQLRALSLLPSPSLLFSPLLPLDKIKKNPWLYFPTKGTAARLYTQRTASNESTPGGHSSLPCPSLLSLRPSLCLSLPRQPESSKAQTLDSPVTPVDIKGRKRTHQNLFCFYDAGARFDLSLPFELSLSTECWLRLGGDRVGERDCVLELEGKVRGIERGRIRRRGKRERKKKIDGGCLEERGEGKDDREPDGFRATFVSQPPRETIPRRKKKKVRFMCEVLCGVWRRFW